SLPSCRFLAGKVFGEKVRIKDRSALTPAASYTLCDPRPVGCNCSEAGLEEAVASGRKDAADWLGVRQAAVRHDFEAVSQLVEGMGQSNGAGRWLAAAVQELCQSLREFDRFSETLAASHDRLMEQRGAER